MRWNELMVNANFDNRSPSQGPTTYLTVDVVLGPPPTVHGELVHRVALSMEKGTVLRDHRRQCALWNKPYAKALNGHLETVFVAAGLSLHKDHAVSRALHVRIRGSGARA